ncbi:protein CHUP1, chloroplastic [Diospyros lotus]|uniref:protein CHUP1, chloroplastic n=1 Tax=Diospyros lotus TaxID=55363 RepID=UPI00224DF646|nr:protein CHUP1, chloroplastic [Diospyros lotus]XP_052208442.1 protein CHUP1, chloroplastic [Diospyros lotus]
MKQETPPSTPPTTARRAELEAKRGGVSSSATPTRLRASSSPKPKNFRKPEASNGFSPSQKARAKTVAPRDSNLHSSQSARRNLAGTEPESGKEVKAVGGRAGNRLVAEQFAPPQRRLVSTHPNPESSKRNGRELEPEKVADRSYERLIGNLQSELLGLKAELDKVRTLNAELQSENAKLSQDLAAAEAKIATLTTRHQAVEDYQNPRFKEIQKLIATKLEHPRVTDEAVNEPSHGKALAGPPAPPMPGGTLDVQRNVTVCSIPPPPPPPRPPAKGSSIRKGSTVADSFHLLAKQDRSKHPSGSRNHDKPVAMSAHSSIVGEIQKRSAHLLAIRVDIETKGELINSLIEKVLDAAYADIEDVLKFVNWLDSQLSLLADERAVLKHFKWPEKKADAMREAAVEYRALKLLESEVSSYKDNASIPCGVALKKMAGLLDKSEQSIHRLIKLRNSVLLSYQHFKIPTDWMLDSGIIRKIKRASVTLAKVYMKRLMMELESTQHTERESAQEGLLLQGFQFAYRAHQFAGELDSETLCAFEEIKQRVPGHLRGSQQLLVGIPSS